MESNTMGSNSAMNDLNIGYSGGSGGFLLLHLLMLSDRYHVEFQQSKTFAEVFEQQWKITNPDHWKDTETWPDNPKTCVSTTSLNKIYFFCNPDENPDRTHYPGLNLVLYTDYRSQLLLTRYKKAFWHYNKHNQPDYSDQFSKYKKLLKHWRTHYQNIKDPTWPDCKSFRYVDQLPSSIQKEILENPYTAKFLNLQYIDPVEKYQEHWVFCKLIPVLTSADITIRLQDLINSNGTILSDLLNLPPINQKQLKFLKQWKQLHSVELLNKIGIHQSHC
jgi:hypothetical protein